MSSMLIEIPITVALFQTKLNLVYLSFDLYQNAMVMSLFHKAFQW